MQRRLVTSRWILAGLLVFLLAGTLVVVGQIRTRATRQATNTAAGTAELVAELSVSRIAAGRVNSGEPLHDDERAALDENIHGLVARGSLVGLEIWSWSGTLLYADAGHPVDETTMPAEELSRSHQGRVWVQSSDDNQRAVRTFEVFVPFDPDGDGTNEGIVEVLTPEDRVAAQARRSTIELAGIVVAFVLVLAVALLGVRRQLLAREAAALHDPLTGLPNRAALADHLHVLRRSRSAGGRLILMLVDLDSFRAVNDTLGHPAGDQLLTQVARTLQGFVRETDVVVRLGGDEFAVLVGDRSRSAPAAELAGRLLERLRTTAYSVDGVGLRIDASIGLADLDEDDADVDGLVRRAEVAMYQAKSSGLGVAAYEPALDTNDVGKLALLGELRDGIDRQELRLHYQPKCRLATGDLVGVEALVRWQHPSSGLLGPDAFVPLAENTGLMRPLTTWVLEHAIAQARQWREAGLWLPVAVNISPRSLLDDELPATVLGLLADAGVPSDLLELEITETAVMTDPDRAMRMCGRLAAAGLRISVDDFGAGYTSLSYLKQMPVSTLKIDRMFVTHLVDDDKDRAITGTVVELGHRLGFTVLAEGIEDAETWQLLKELGCDEGQGYHLARPMPADDLLPWIESRSVASRYEI